MKKGNIFFTFDDSTEWTKQWLECIEELKALTARNRSYAAFVRDSQFRNFEQARYKTKPEDCTCHLYEYAPDPVALANDEFVINLINTCVACYAS